MDKQELQRMRQQALEEQKQFYREHPDLANWVKTKKVLLWIVVAYWVLHMVFMLLIMVQIQSFDGVGREIVKLIFQLFWLYVIINPEGGWRLNVVLYFWAFVNFGMLIMYSGDMRQMLSYIFYMPLYGVIMLMEIAAPFLLLALAVFLTAFPKHRAMSEQVEAMRKRNLDFTKNVSQR